MTNIIISIIINIAVSNAPPSPPTMLDATNYLFIGTNHSTNCWWGTNIFKVELRIKSNPWITVDTNNQIIIRPENAPKPDTTTDWYGEPCVGTGDQYFHNVGWLPGFQMGLRSDGVMVWRKKQ